MRPSFCITVFFLLLAHAGSCQQKASIRMYKKLFTTYPFSDPDPVPKIGRIYPYFRYDGYAGKPVQKAWQVVELSNDYITVMILPEIGGKVWAAIEKSTGKPFVYYNHVIKFRDIAMRGPWTSGGIEPNYGIIGHTPNCATSVDFTTLTKSDGSVSCVVGVLDLLTRTSWRLDINLPRDKAYITTSSFWYNSTALEQPYYTWMNTGLPAKGNLEFIYPGNRYIGHGGEYAAWPKHETNGKNINWYGQNDFGGPKSYHVFGKYTDFFGAYWHDDDYGMVRYGNYGDKPGKKIWIWGLSQQGMIWEKLLSDTDGQYVEVQSGRMFNQAAEQSTFTPFKHIAFAPAQTDTWTEYWYPVLGTKGMVAASNFGALNLRHEGGWLKINFAPVAPIDDTLKITSGEKTLYNKKIRRAPMQPFADSIRQDGNTNNLVAVLGNHKLKYEAAPDAQVLNRPVDSPKDFDWNSAYGLYIQGKEAAHQRDYITAISKIKAALEKDPNLLPALTELAKLQLRNRNHKEALAAAAKALSIDTYDPEANYYYGIINAELGLDTDAKDGFDIAALNPAFRSAALLEQARLAFREQNYTQAVAFARKSTDFNRFNMGAFQLLAMVYRLQGNQQAAKVQLDTLLSLDPLHHFAFFEQYLLQPTAPNKQAFTGKITNELPQETYLELAIAYYKMGRKAEASTLLSWAPQNAEVKYWLAFLQNKALDTSSLNPHLVFPFRTETAEVLEQLLPAHQHWMLQYHLALVAWHLQDTTRAKELFAACGNRSNYAPFYAARAELNKNNTAHYLADLQKAMQLDPRQWRYGQSLSNFYLAQKESAKALALADHYYQQQPANYIMGMQKAKALMQAERYSEAAALLDTLTILPYEGATEGRQLYKETHLMLATSLLKQQHYQQALQQVNLARQWPEHLGVGKPYEGDNDERLEDWISYRIYKASGKTAKAQQMLDKILAFSNQQKAAGEAYSSPNRLITAWALQQQGKTSEATTYLSEWTQKEPQNKMAQWAWHTFQQKEPGLQETPRGDENFRVLLKLLQ